MSDQVTYWCRFCGDRAVAIYAMDEGCQCFPEDREQALCPQHVISANPIGGMEIINDLTGGAWSKFMAEHY